MKIDLNGRRRIFILSAVLAGFVTIGCSCANPGERITETVVEDRILSLPEFRSLFRVEELNAKCFWYFGRDGAYSRVEIDESKPTDAHDSEFNRRVHHNLRRFRIAESEVTFSPAIPFSGYDKGKRIVAPHLAGPDRVVYTITGDFARP